MAKPTEETNKKTHTLEYKLPDGAVVTARRPFNGIRRAIIDMPDTAFRNLPDIVASACVVKLDLPAEYEFEGSPARVIEFEDNCEVKPDTWSRLDVLTMGDAVVFTEAFTENSVHAREMIAKVATAAKAKN